MGDLNPWHILSLVMTGFTGLLTWLGLKQISRIDALEREKATSAAVTAEIAKLERGQERIADRIDEYQDATHRRLDNIFQELVRHQ